MPTGIYIRTANAKRNMSLAHIGKTGENASNWRGGLKYNKEYRRKYNKNWKKKNKEYFVIYSREMRHRKGKQYVQTCNNKRREQTKNLTLTTVQLVYEDNIKRFGTLTCYLCFQSIPFGKDNLEHKIPLSRKGTNEYNNLAIACQKCNCSKGKKTEEEYRKEILSA